MRISRSPTRLISEITIDQNVPMAGFILTGLGAGVAAGNSLRYEQLVGAYLPGTPKVKTADEIVNNSAVLQNDDDLFFAVAANGIWVVILCLKAKSPTLTTLKIAFTIPAAASMIDTCLPPQYHAFIAGNDATVAAALSAMAATSKYIYLAYLYIGGANAGTIQLQWAQNAATAENTTLEKGSNMLCTQLA
jgi:hypothetical protein